MLEFALPFMIAGGAIAVPAGPSSRRPLVFRAIGSALTGDPLPGVPVHADSGSVAIARSDWTARTFAIEEDPRDVGPTLPKRIDALLRDGRVPEARAALANATSIERGLPEVIALERLLEPKAATAVPREGPRISQRANLRWLRENASRYPGRWLAVSAGQLLANGRNLAEVRREAEGKAVAANVLLHFQPAPGWPSS